MEHVDVGLAPDRDGVVDAALVARALALIDDGSIADARELLAAALADAGVDRPAERLALSSHDAFEPLGDAELESAFDDARPETDSMIDADGIAFEAIRRAKLDAPESVSLPAPDSPFHTRTMADLLERQGDAEGARAIRAALEDGAFESETSRVSVSTGEGRARTIQTLERWLTRLRGGDA